ncbi:MAG: S8 family serine peptidase [Candidatus Odinarchaeota archaeon]|nr:S8 family serine peptidase [Candidatus Odinarchaeota archaeon]
MATVAKYINQFDVNNNKIQDGLETQLSSVGEDEFISLGVTFYDLKIMKNVLSFVRASHGKILGYWNQLRTAHLEISKSLFSTIFERWYDAILFVYPLGYKAKSFSYVSTKLIGVRPYLWNTLGLLGDPNASIAIVDSGLDPTHVMLGNYSDLAFDNANVKIVGWYDPTGGTASPEDKDGHGTHVASLAAGNFYSGDPDEDSDIDITIDMNTISVNNDGTEYFVVFGIFINATGELRASLNWTSTSSNDVYISRLQIVDPNSITKADDTTDPFNVSYTITNTDTMGYWAVYIGITNNSQTANTISFQLHIESPIEQDVDGRNTFSGIAPNTKIVGVVLGDTETQIIDGITWIYNNAEKYHILVVSNSWGLVDSNGNPTTSLDVELAFQKLIDKGLIVVAAAGNEGNTGLITQIGTPGNMEEVITVAATDSNFNIAYYSSRGPAPGSDIIKPDISAPGGVYGIGAIIGADTNEYELYGSEIFNSLTMMQGTSMATPIVAGTAALLAEALGGYENWDYSPTDLTKSKAFKVRQALLMTAWETNSRNSGKDTVEGYGFLQANAAIDALTKSWNISHIETGFLGDKSSKYASHVWARNVYLEAGSNYTFYLQVPNSGDFDLFLFAPDPDSYGEPVLVGISNETTTGNIEIINYQPTKTGSYYIVIKQASGSGSFQLSSFAVEPIHITVTSPSNRTFTNNHSLLVSWTVNTTLEIDHFEISLNGSIVASNVTATATSEVITVTNDGFYHLFVKAVSTIGSFGENSTTFIADFTPPMITIKGIENYNITANDTIQIMVSENIALSRIIISLDGNVLLNTTEYKRTAMFSISVADLKKLSSGNHTLIVSASDKAGNNATVSKTYTLKGTLGGISGLSEVGYGLLPFALFGMLFTLLTYPLVFVPEPIRSIVALAIPVMLYTLLIIRKRKTS